MEDGLLGFVIMALTVVSVIIKSQKKKQKVQQKKAAPVQQTVQNRPGLEESLRNWFEAETASTPAGAGLGASREVTHEGMHPCDIHSSEPARAAQPRVQVSTRPRVVMGSMQTDSHEGLHPCDEHEGMPEPTVQPMLPIEEERPGIQLDWTGDNLVKTFIMQEVLTRPCRRRRA